jgi:hypothetical protein
MVVWSDSVDDIIPSCLDLEGRLLKLVWKARHGSTYNGSSTNLNNTLSRHSMFGMSGSATASRMSLGMRKPTGTNTDIELTEKNSMAELTSPNEMSSSMTMAKEKELEAGGVTGPAPRPTKILASIYIGIAVALSTCKSFPFKFRFSLFPRLWIPLSLVSLAATTTTTTTTILFLFPLCLSRHHVRCHGPKARQCLPA